MANLQSIFQALLHLDTSLISFISAYGFLTYAALFAIIFCETGLVITPFLPGDSLLFAAGSIASASNHLLSIQLLLVLLILASILGNKVNYLFGKAIGPRVFKTNTWLLNKRHLLEAHHFYEKHGGKTIILARFLPIIRTFAPFIAGVGYMEWHRFAIFNIVSAILWVGSLLGIGYLFGNLPFVKNNFTVVIYAIILLSLLPPFLTFLAHQFRLKLQK